MKAQARAFAPGNISCVFKVVADPDPRKMHSLGMGLTVSDGVVASVAHAERSAVRFNGEEIDFPTVVAALEKLTAEPLDVDIQSPLQLSGGFGLSGASSLAALWAADDLLSLGTEERELAMMAHVAEVENLTGLGDVCAQFHGGCLVKLTAGDPLAADSGLLTDERVRGIIEEVERSAGAASMIMLGHAVFSTRAFPGAQETQLGIYRVRAF